MRHRSPELERPAFRPLEVHWVEQDGKRGLVLIDPLGIVEGQVFIPEALVPIVGRFDGNKTLAEIGDEASATLGEPVPVALVADLVQQLDDGLLLLSPQFQATFEQTVAEFAARPVRPASHAGSAGYPSTAGACREALDAILREGPPPAATARRVRGLVAPHIDLARGRAGYASAYGCLRGAATADLFVIFGTGHKGPSAPVTGLAMDWQTPLGVVRTDREFVTRVHDRLGGPAPHDVFLHRSEHSVEFQVLFLAHLFADRPFQVAGFITAGLPSASGDPSAESYAKQLLAAFREAAAASGKTVCYVAGADLAHLGPAFGDPDPVDAGLLARLDAGERARLAHLEQGDPGAFHRGVVAAGNPDRVCGAAPIFLTAALAGGRGQLLHYGQAAAADGSQVVSFCSMAF